MDFEIRTNFAQIRNFGRADRTMTESLHGSEGGVSGFGTLIAVLCEIEAIAVK